MIAARQAKLALDIAHKTLPYFRNINSESLATICDIIRQDIRADAVAITDTHQVLAYVGVGREAYPIGREGLSRVTAKAFATAKSSSRTTWKTRRRRRSIRSWWCRCGKKAK